MDSLQVRLILVIARDAFFPEIFDDFVYRSLFHHFPATDEKRVIRFFQNGWTVGNEKDGTAHFLEKLNGIKDPVQGFYVDAGVGFIHHHESGLHGEDGGQFDSLSLSARQGLIHGPRQVFIRFKAHALKRLPAVP
jgi:hypothetical protein